MTSISKFQLKVLAELIALATAHGLHKFECGVITVNSDLKWCVRWGGGPHGPAWLQARL